MSDTNNAAAFLQSATSAGASDIFVVAGLPISYKVNGIMHTEGERLMPHDTELFIRNIYELAGNRSIERFLETGDDDFSFAIPGLSRFRVSTYKQRGSLAAVIRIIAFELPRPDEIGIPPAVLSLTSMTKGLIPGFPAFMAAHCAASTQLQAGLLPLFCNSSLFCQTAPEDARFARKAPVPC